MPRLPLLATLLAGALALLLAPRPAPAQPPRRLRVLTWNAGTLDPRALRLPEDALPRVVEVIAAARPDVALLQEVAPGQPALIAAGLRARGLPFHAATCVVDPAHPDGLSLVLTRERPRARLRARLPLGWNVQGADLDGLSILCVHAPSSGPPDRAAYFAQLGAWAGRELRGPLLVAGDFNLGPRRGAGLAAVLPWQRRVDVATWTRFRAGFEAGSDVSPTTVYRLQLDHLLARGARIDAARRLDGRRLPQDHDPLLVDLTIGGRQPGLSGAVSR